MVIVKPAYYILLSCTLLIYLLLSLIYHVSLHVLKTRSYPMIVLEVVMMMFVMTIIAWQPMFFSWMNFPPLTEPDVTSPVPTADRLTELSWHEPSLPHLRPPSAWVSAAELRRVSGSVGFRFRQYPKMRISQWTGLDWSWFDNIWVGEYLNSYSVYKWILTRQLFSSRCVQLRIFNKHRIPVAPRVSRTLANPA